MSTAKRWAWAGVWMTICGMAGVAARPAAACPTNYDPVCDVAGNTHANACFAGGAELACAGACPCWAPDRVFGQSSLTETAYNEIVGVRSFNVGGVLVDRLPAPQPSRVWVWDAGNNRVLGFSHIGTCAGGTNPGTPCTENSICTGGGACTGNLNQPPTVVLGQPNAASASCNHDNTSVAPAAPDRLCAIPYPFQPSPLEGPRGNSMAVDASHDLYLVDHFNNRILRYDDPFTNDASADWVWGQADFEARGCNRGNPGIPTSTTLCTGQIDVFQDNFYFATGLDVTASGSHVWVADLGNHRVLRINTLTSQADTVIGQADYSTRTRDCNLLSAPHVNLCKPNSVQFDDATGRLYVLHGDNNNGAVARIFVYDPPLINGMAPTAIYQPPSGSEFFWPRGLTLDPHLANAIWINDVDNSRVLQYVNGTPTRVLSKPHFALTGCRGDLLPTGPIYPQVCNPTGGLGIDRDGSVYVTDWQEQHVERFPGPIPTPNHLGLSHPPDARLWYVDADHANQLHANQVSAVGLANPGDALIVGSQLVVADRQRIVFWNNYASGGPVAGAASGVLAQPAFDTQANPSVTHGNDFRALGHDATRQILYAAHGPYITAWSTAGGLTSLAAPLFQISHTLPVRGGGTTPFGASGIAIDAATDSAWISDSANHRILRVLNLSQSGTREVDAVIGQPTVSTPRACNRSAPSSFSSILSANSFCIPTQAVFDTLGNLYVVDGTWEGNGNRRVLQFKAATLPPIPSPQVVWATGGPQADRVYAKPNFTTRQCVSEEEPEHPCRPRFVSFEPGTNRMILSVDAYANPLHSRVFIYNDPNAATAPTPDNRIRLPFNQAAASTWDAAGRMAILDHTWNRVLLFQDPPATPPLCRNHDGNVDSCDAADGCAYYFCSGQCHRQGTSNCDAGCKEDC